MWQVEEIPSANWYRILAFSGTDSFQGLSECVESLQSRWSSAIYPVGGLTVKQGILDLWDCSNSKAWKHPYAVRESSTSTHSKEQMHPNASFCVARQAPQAPLRVQQISPASRVCSGATFVKASQRTNGLSLELAHVSSQKRRLSNVHQAISSRNLDTWTSD